MQPPSALQASRERTSASYPDLARSLYASAPGCTFFLGQERRDGVSAGELLSIARLA